MIANTILIVDDDAELRDNLTDILQDEGYELLNAATCAEGLRLASERRPQAALLDVRLPDGSGMELLTQLKQTNPDCFCIMITGCPDLNSAVAALEKGAFQYVRKPVQPTKLLKLLEDVFETISLREKEQQAKEALRKRNKELEGTNKRLNMIVTSAKRLASSSRLKGFGPLLEIGPLLLKEFTKNLSAEGGSLYICKEDSLFLVDSLG
ncbi:MAG: response regulator, partial [Deltaproteobacteria bacterium]|nr:response regulator [Deltaproteobacteria bacterium]